MRLATVHKIRNIDWTRSGIHGTGSLSPRARRLLAVFVVLVKGGYGGVEAPLGAIADCVWRSSSGEARSIRTVQRANNELETMGYVQIRRNRTKYSKIIFNLEAFAYWTKRSFQNVSPIMCDNSPHTTNCHTSEVKTDRSRVTSQISSEKTLIKPRAGARANNTSARRQKNAIEYSLERALDTVQLSAADKARARARAKIEIAALAARIALVKPSGIDWPYWLSKWPEFPIYVRQSTMIREILPVLLDRPVLPQNVFRDSPRPKIQIPKQTMTIEQIRVFTKNFTDKIPKEQKKETADNVKKTADITLTRDDGLEILLKAREKLQNYV